MTPGSLVIVLAVVCIGLGIATLSIRHQLREARSRLDALAAEHQDLGHQFRALLSCSRDIGDRISEYNRKQRNFDNRLNSFAHLTDGEALVGQAQKLLAKGLATDEVSTICGLSSAETRLLARLSANHRKLTNTHTSILSH